MWWQGPDLHALGGANISLSLVSGYLTSLARSPALLGEINRDFRDAPIMTTAEKTLRQRQLAQIHMAKKALGMAEDTYRSLLKTVCQVESSSMLDLAGRLKFLAHLEKCGWKPANNPGKPLPKLTPQQRKAVSLWLRLADLKIVQDRSFTALESFVKRQTGVDKLIWCNTAQLDQVILALKAWGARPNKAA